MTRLSQLALLARSFGGMVVDSDSGRWRVRARTMIVIGLAFAEAAACQSSTSPASYDPKIDPARFVASVTNPLFPLVPGTVIRYDGQTEDGTEIDSVIVTSTTKVILGVTTTVVRDVAYLNGVLEEETFDWYAQDVDGNVWYFGEDTKAYHAGRPPSTAGSWEAGRRGAKPGIIMKASPKVGDHYRQEFLAGEAEDEARVLSLNETVTVPAGTFTGCIKTEEWTRLEPGVREHKFFCPAVGETRSLMVKGGSEHAEVTGIARP